MYTHARSHTHECWKVTKIIKSKKKTEKQRENNNKNTFTPAGNRATQKKIVWANVVLMPSFPFPFSSTHPPWTNEIFVCGNHQHHHHFRHEFLSPQGAIFYMISVRLHLARWALPHLLLLLTSILFVCQELFASLSSGPAVGGCQSEGVGSILNQVSNNHYSSPGRMPWSLRGSRVEWQSRKYMPN